MRSQAPFLLAVGLFLGMMSWAIGDNYFKNADFKEGSQAWRGDGKAAFLKPDGTEGSEDDPGVIPVIRLSLSKGQAHSVYQEFQPQDAPGRLRIKVEVYASIDFKRSSHASDYATDDVMTIPNDDFGVRILPDYFQQPFHLVPGKWTKV